MKSMIALAALLLSLTTAGFAVPVNAGTLHIRVSGIKNAQGDLLCALFANGENFPGGDAVGRAKVAANPAGIECMFDHIAAGRYAVAVVHDENGNGKMDRVPLFGIPLEGYGVSNNKTYATHGPRFEESAFAYDGQADMTVEIRLRY